MCRSSRTTASRRRLSRSMWASRMSCRDSTHFFSVFGRTGSGFTPALPVAAEYQNGSVIITRKAARPAMILPLSYIALLLPFVDGLLFHFVDGFQAQVDRPLHLQFLVRAQAGAAAAAERLLADGVYGHLLEVAADVTDDVPRLLQDPHRARGVARVVERHLEQIVLRRVELELAVLDGVRRELDDVDHLGW